MSRFNLVLLLMVFGGLAGVGNLRAAGRQYVHSQAVFQEEGDTAVPYAVTCSSISWTTFLAANPIRRVIITQPVNANLTSVCISSMTTAAYACLDGTPGVEISSSTLVWRSQAAWKCRSRQVSGATDTRGVLKGFYSQDTGDLGIVQ